MESLVGAAKIGHQLLTSIIESTAFLLIGMWKTPYVCVLANVWVAELMFTSHLYVPMSDGRLPKARQTKLITTTAAKPEGWLYQWS